MIPEELERRIGQARQEVRLALHILGLKQACLWSFWGGTPSLPALIFRIAWSSTSMLECSIFLNCLKRESMAVFTCCDPARLSLTENSENVLGCSVHLITSWVQMLWGTSIIFLLFPPI